MIAYLRLTCHASPGAKGKGKAMDTSEDDEEEEEEEDEEEESEEEDEEEKEDYPPSFCLGVDLEKVGLVSSVPVCGCLRFQRASRVCRRDKCTTSCLTADAFLVPSWRLLLQRRCSAAHSPSYLLPTV